ncbi:hypothetical protein CFK35_17730 [Clostridium sp. cpc1]|uniref:DUF3787 domain-containing protein n=1 Tax=Clostridium sp. cpc1 TaxID=2016536 RepID=UPI0022408CCE|nr:DUF3787 domain-containing protein [Clostridium sp. cpc1]MCW7999717.1 hypothetical protein [Clostridium sp. cpc1]
MTKNNDKNLNININRFKEKKMSIPIENQKTAAYYDIKGLKPESRVPIPTLEGVVRAKEWVEQNQK